MNTAQIISRLEGYSKRLRGSVVQAQCLKSTFQSLNENENWRQAISRSRATSAANIMQHAVLRELILILVRVFDRPRGPIEKSEKVSFPVISQWLEKDDVRDALIANARNWFPAGYRADENEASVRDATQRLRDGLHRLATETPNREKRLRQFRDEFLAHELHFEIARDKPLFGHIYEMVDEVTSLAEAASLAVEGTSVAWNFADDGMRESADALWSAVAKAAK